MNLWRKSFGRIAKSFVLLNLGKKFGLFLQLGLFCVQRNNRVFKKALQSVPNRLGSMPMYQCDHSWTVLCDKKYSCKVTLR
jgi:hypothetical protein